MLWEFMYEFIFPSKDLYTIAYYDFQWAVSLLAFLTVVLLPVPFVLFKYGHAIRARSSYKPISAVKNPS
jgi:hypothetical protein